MYEDITFEQILQRMLDKVPDTVDKREGSIIYDALAPVAVELQLMYIALDNILDETFVDTQSRESLIKRCVERGVPIKEATRAILKGEFNIDVPIGSRFSLDLFNYTAIEKISDGVYKMECETAGSQGNMNLGTIIPISYIEGLESAELTEILIPGEDEENAEQLREKYYNSLDAQAFGGNIADYKEKTNKLDGVGGTKVYPAWNGGGTVKLVIIDSNYNVPSSVLVDEVQTIIDPIQNQGVGLAPIGHVVTVAGVTSAVINIATEATCQDGWYWVDVEPYVHEVIDNYFLEISKDWANKDNIIVRISQLETRLLDLAGIIDIANTTINGLTQNAILDTDSIPVRGDVIG